MGLACCTVAVGQDPQPGWQWVEAAVEYDYARSCSFTDGGIAHVGSNGLCLRKGTADVLIQGNEVGDTGGGLLYEPADPASLAERITELLRDPARAAEYGRRAQEAVRARYTAPRMAEEMLALYRELCGPA